jgi:hypothetical protein
MQTVNGSQERLDGVTGSHFIAKAEIGSEDKKMLVEE